MGNGDNSAVGELAPDGLLDELIRLQIHSSGGLIQDQNLGFPKESPAQAQELPLPYAAASRRRHKLVPTTRGTLGLREFHGPDQTFTMPAPTCFKLSQLEQSLWE